MAAARPVIRRVVITAAILLAVGCASASAQDAPPPIPRFVVDLHGTVPRFPDTPQLAQSRGLSPAELPGTGLGVDVGAHFYLLKWRAITFGLGGELMTSRAHATPPTATGQSTPLRAVTERFSSIAPQLSFNFGTGTGWSYLSGGIGRSRWSIVPEAGLPTDADEEALKTINYGGGARWFVKSHLAFSFDVRFYAINPGTPQAFGPGSPRTTLLVAGAGVSLR